jgi:hypothetical protein
MSAPTPQKRNKEGGIKRETEVEPAENSHGWFRGSSPIIIVVFWGWPRLMGRRTTHKQGFLSPLLVDVTFLDWEICPDLLARHIKKLAKNPKSKKFGYL